MPARKFKYTSVDRKFSPRVSQVIIANKVAEFAVGGSHVEKISSTEKFASTEHRELSVDS